MRDNFIYTYSVGLSPYTVTKTQTSSGYDITVMNTGSSSFQGILVKPTPGGGASAAGNFVESFT